MVATWSKLLSSATCHLEIVWEHYCNMGTKMKIDTNTCHNSGVDKMSCHTQWVLKINFCCFFFSSLRCHYAWTGHTSQSVIWLFLLTQDVQGKLQTSPLDGGVTCKEAMVNCKTLPLDGGVVQQVFSWSFHPLQVCTVCKWFFKLADDEV